MPHDWYQERISQALSDRNVQGLLRTRRVFKPLGKGLIEVDGRRLINFGSNDYLGLAWNEEVIAAANLVPELDQVLDRSAAWGSGASPLVTGRTLWHDQLEQSLSIWKGVESSLSFSSGYATNVSVISAIASKQDLVFSDELNHASLIDGCRLSKANVSIYKHLDYQQLFDSLKNAQSTRKKDQGCYIVSDTVFSMEGDTACIETLVDLAKQFDAVLVFDEAHAVGIFGEGGRGLAEPPCLAGVPVISIGTCSKALGSIGGYVGSEKKLIDYLCQFARGYIYSTAMPAAATRATLAAIRLCQGMDYDREQLRLNARFFRDQLREAGLQTSGIDSPICPIYMPTPERAVEASQKLLELGFFVPAIRPPTVPRGKNLLRVSLSVSHSESQVLGLLGALNIICS